MQDRGMTGVGDDSAAKGAADGDRMDEDRDEDGVLSDGTPAASDPEELDPPTSESRATDARTDVNGTDDPAPDNYVGGDVPSGADGNDVDSDLAAPTHDARPEDEDPFYLDDDFEQRFGSSTSGAQRARGGQGDDLDVMGVRSSAAYAEMTRSEPGLDRSRWLIVGAVTVAFIMLSFLMIPKIFENIDDPDAAATTSVAPTVATSSAPPLKGYGQTVLGAQPVHSWRFNSAAPTADELGTSNLTFGESTLALGSTAVKDSVGAIDCDGTFDSSVNSQTPELATGDFSIELWFNTASGTGGQLVSFGDEAEQQSDTVTRSLYIDGTGQVHIGIRAGKRYDAESEKSYADGAWHHAVGTYSQTDGLTLYVDGQQVAHEPAGVGAIDLEGGFWRICGDNLTSWPGASAGPYYLGSLDEVSVYNRALSADIIAANFAAAQAGQPG